MRTAHSLLNNKKRPRRSPPVNMCVVGASFSVHCLHPLFPLAACVRRRPFVGWHERRRERERRRGRRKNALSLLVNDRGLTMMTFLVLRLAFWCCTQDYFFSLLLQSWNIPSHYVIFPLSDFQRIFRRLSRLPRSALLAQKWTKYLLLNVTFIFFFSTREHTKYHEKKYTRQQSQAERERSRGKNADHENLMMSRGLRSLRSLRERAILLHIQQF